MLTRDPDIPEWIDRLHRQAGIDRNEYQRLHRLEKLRTFLEQHLGASVKDCQRALGWSYWTTSNYMEIIRNEWKRK